MPLKQLLPDEQSVKLQETLLFGQSLPVEQAERYLSSIIKELDKGYEMSADLKLTLLANEMSNGQASIKTKSELMNYKNGLDNEIDLTVSNNSSLRLQRNDSEGPENDNQNGPVNGRPKV